MWSWCQSACLAARTCEFRVSQGVLMVMLHYRPWDASFGRVLPECCAEHGCGGVELQGPCLNGGPYVFEMLDVLHSALALRARSDCLLRSGFCL